MRQSLTLIKAGLVLLVLLFSTATLSAQKNQVALRYIAPNYILGLGKVPTPLEGAETFGSGLEFEYQRRIAPNFLLGVPIRLSTGEALVNMEDASKDPVNPFTDVEELSVIGGNLLFIFEPIARSSVFDPQIFTGFGAFNDFDGNTTAELPIGVNLNLRLGNGFYLSPQASWRFAFGPDQDIRRNVQLGIGAHLQLNAEPVEPEPPAVVDSDGDGIEDSADQCPNQAGPVTTLGCPDTDGDGIADKDDKCPAIAGTSAYMGCPDTDGDGIADPDDGCPEQAGPESNNGCPVTDRDGDGVPDAEDKCPNEAGLLTLMGCPDFDGDGIADRDDDCPRVAGLAKMNGCPDTDGDGVTDRDDKCPKQAGPATNQGCPEITVEDQETIDFAIQNINFETASATLTAESRSVLDRVEDILRRYPGYMLAIGGHTDSVGSAESNQKLSNRRAESVYTYLVGKGIIAARMSYAGFGETMPIADNRYKDGREQNRRVTLDLSIR
ncbi:hypothetical protein CEQ90_00850 [Lewinellaceae bacterium SD302]|nr:hypothetical protein CEQ90_00850 [Lewinellaceae bacterium SD302]